MAINSTILKRKPQRYSAFICSFTLFPNGVIEVTMRWPSFRKDLFDLGIKQKK